MVGYNGNRGDRGDRGDQAGPPTFTGDHGALYTNQAGTNPYHNTNSYGVHGNGQFLGEEMDYLDELIENDPMRRGKL